MADVREVYSRSGRLYYNRCQSLDPPRGYFRSRTARPHLLRIAQKTSIDTLRLDCDISRNKSRAKERTRKLANTRDNAKKFLRFITAKQDQPQPTDTTSRRSSRRWSTLSASFPSEMDMASGEGSRNAAYRAGSGVGGPVSGMLPRPSLAEDVRTASAQSGISTTSITSGTAIGDEKPIASGNGISISIALAEPMLFLQGFDSSDSTSRTTTMLRGSLHLKVSKSAKIKTIYLKFRGKAETEWPEGMD